MSLRGNGNGADRESGRGFDVARALLWEDLLTFVVDPASRRVRDPQRVSLAMEMLLRRHCIEPDWFWAQSPARRSRLFLDHYSRTSRDVPRVELAAFDIEKLLKERFRREPLTIGAAWHHGFWRSYFSHAAITHPANDGLREEFSTAWDIVRKQPAVIFRRADSLRVHPLRSIRLDLPVLVGPLPFSQTGIMERAYLEAAAAADPASDLNTRTLVVVEADRWLACAERLRGLEEDVLPRLEPRHVPLLSEGGALRAVVRAARVVEVAPRLQSRGDDLESLANAVAAVNPEALLGVYLRYRPEHDAAFWALVERAARHDAVALVEVDSGPLKSYRLMPRVDAFLKDRLLRARVQLVSAGGDTDTQASAATVYEGILLGANAGAMTYAAAIALAPATVDVLLGASVAGVDEQLARTDEDDLFEMALCTLTCWQHSILDFLSCMGIDDVQKTSGNTMAITMTADWVREVDALAQPDFARANAAANRRRVAAEPVPPEVRRRYRVSALLREVTPDLPLVNAARVLAQRDASYHIDNSSRALNADFLEVVYRMASGRLPEEDEFLLSGGQGELSLDGVGLKLSRASLAWSVARLHRSPALLDYISLAVPRGFLRPGAVWSRAVVTLHTAPEQPALARLQADASGGLERTFGVGHPLHAALERGGSLWLRSSDGERVRLVELLATGHGAGGTTVARASADGAITLRCDPRGTLVLSGFGVREPVWHGPVCHASMSLGAASEDFLMARIRGNADLTMTTSGEGGPIRLASAEDMKWESLQAASGHFGITGTDLRRVRDVEIKINQGAKPGKGGRLAGAKVTPTVSKARNIPVGTDALSPDPKHDIYSIEDMPAEVWLWLLYHTHCGIKVTGSNYTRYVAAGMWSNFVVDYLLIDAGVGGSGNYHADSSHVGWPDIFRTILHTHHALMGERVDLDGSGELLPIRDLNGAPYGAQGGTRLFASGGLRGELDMLKVLIAGADALVEASISKAVAFGCNQCGNCHLDCPRGGITTKPELTVQNDRVLMAARLRNWTALNMVKLAVLIDALNRESGALDEDGRVVRPDLLLDDIRLLRGRTDLLDMPVWPANGEEDQREPRRVPSEEDSQSQVSVESSAGGPVVAEHDSCRVGSLAVTVPVTVDAIWEAARLSYNGGNNRGGGLDFAGFAPPPLRDKTCFVVNTIGPDRAETVREMLTHFGGCRFWAADGEQLAAAEVVRRLDDLRLPVRERYVAPEGWRRADLREDPGDFHLFFVDLEPCVLARYAKRLIASPQWLQVRTKYADVPLARLAEVLDPSTAARPRDARALAFRQDVLEEYFTALAHVLDSRFYRTHGELDSSVGKYAAKRRGYVVSMGEDLAAVKISGWTHTIPEYFDFGRFWAVYPGAATFTEAASGDGAELRAHVWGMHHRYPTNSPAIDAEGRGNPAGAHPFKAYNVLLMHNGEQVGVDSTSPFLREYGYLHADESMGEGWRLYEGDSVYDRKALTDTEYAAYLVDFTRRVLGLSTEHASQIISPITGIDLDALDEERRLLCETLSRNYVQLTPTGPYKFTIVESRPVLDAPCVDGAAAVRRVGFRENMDIKFLRPHELVVSDDTSPGGVCVVANGSEAKIADAMLRVLHHQGVLADAGHDLRFNMRPGGAPGRGEYGGVVEAFLTPGVPSLDLANRFGEPIVPTRAGGKIDAARPTESLRPRPEWRREVDGMLEELSGALPPALDAAAGRFLPPDEPLLPAAERLVSTVLERLPLLARDDYRHLVDVALPQFAEAGVGERAAALRVLTSLRKRVQFADPGGVALSSLEYLTDGGRGFGGQPEGGIYRILDGVPPLAAVLAEAHAPAGRWGRLTATTRDDLLPPTDAARDVLVIDLGGFVGEAFTLECATRLLTEAVRVGWRHIVGYGCQGGPRYLGSNLAAAEGSPAPDVVLELYGREVGDFLGALLEGAQLWLYGQGQSHAGMKADSGYLFVLQDALNTCCYAAHGGTFNVWNSGSRFAVAGQNRVYLADGEALAPGFKSIHFGSPNEYAFEYLMSGGQNSLHVVLGLAKPDARGRLALRARPYMGKFFMSGAAAGRVFVFDPQRTLQADQYRGNLAEAVTPEVWRAELVPFLATEVLRREAPLRVEPDGIALHLAEGWRHWAPEEAFLQLTPRTVSRRLVKRGVTPPQLEQIVEE